MSLFSFSKKDNNDSYSLYFSVKFSAVGLSNFISSNFNSGTKLIKLDFIVCLRPSLELFFTFLAVSMILLYNSLFVSSSYLLIPIKVANSSY